VDGVLFMPNCSMLYLEELPINYFDNEFAGWARVSWAFTYGGPTRDTWYEGFQPHQKAHTDAFLHPIFRYADTEGPSPLGDTLHMGEDFATRWKSAVPHIGLVRRYLRRSVQRAYGRTGACGVPAGQPQIAGPEGAGGMDRLRSALSAQNFREASHRFNHQPIFSKQVTKQEQSVQKQQQKACQLARSCQQCVVHSACAWCLEEGKCDLDKRGSCPHRDDHVGAMGTGKCPEQPDHPPPPPLPPPPPVDSVEPARSAACEAVHSCQQCSQTSGCAWCIAAAKCAANEQGACASREDHVGEPGIGSCPGQPQKHVSPKQHGQQSSAGACEGASSCEECTNDKQCAWCLKASHCVSNERGSCTSQDDHVALDRGTGLCPAGAARGARTALTSTGSFTTKIEKEQVASSCRRAESCQQCTQNSECAWCLQEAKCHMDEQGTCASRDDHVGGQGAGRC